MSFFFVASLLVLELGVNAWLLAYGTRETIENSLYTRALKSFWSSRHAHWSQMPCVHFVQIIFPPRRPEVPLYSVYFGF